jgi:hypothetical protein
MEQKPRHYIQGRKHQLKSYLKQGHTKKGMPCFFVFNETFFAEWRISPIKKENATEARKMAYFGISMLQFKKY